MKIPMLICLLILFGCSEKSNKKNLKRFSPLEEKDANLFYEISVDQEFEIDLTSNLTTGYSWIWVNNQSLNIVDSISQEYVSNSNLSKLLGVGGKEIWKFKGVKSGVDSIIMKYCQSWNPDATKDLTTIRIKVR